MVKMSAIDKLREELNQRIIDNELAISLLNEIENGYMELPKVEGVPVRPGKAILFYGKERLVEMVRKEVPELLLSDGTKVQAKQCKIPDSLEKIEADIECYFRELFPEDHHYLSVKEIFERTKKVLGQ